MTFSVASLPPASTKHVSKMWLLNTTTLKLELFYDNLPSYVILSHRWEGSEELSFGDLHDPPLRYSKGYEKVRRFCEEARCNDYTHVWADTCCIDKKSSAELSEAINSMYEYYKQAAICYAYLNDVSSLDGLAKSSWFTRGWTLQELLAPSVLVFLNHDWTAIGFKEELAGELECITGIPGRAFRKFDSSEYCVAEKFSWSAHRITTRAEDVAYCLLGLFEVNMPLLYGESHRAFARLQEEIMRMSTDLSIFAWQGVSCDRFGMLAESASCFRTIPSSMKEPAYIRQLTHDAGWIVGNAGIVTEATVIPYLLTSQLEEIYLLNLFHGRANKQHFIFLVKEGGRERGRLHAFRRAMVNHHAWLSTEEAQRIKYYSYGAIQLRLGRRPVKAFLVHDQEHRDIIVRLTSACPFRKWSAHQRVNSGSAPQRGGSSEMLKTWVAYDRPDYAQDSCLITASAYECTRVHG